MKAKLIFKLPEDYEEYRMAVDASSIHHVLFTLDQWLRSYLKYPPDHMTDDTYNTFQLVRDKINELLVENNIEL